MKIIIILSDCFKFSGGFPCFRVLSPICGVPGDDCISLDLNVSIKFCFLSSYHFHASSVDFEKERRFGWQASQEHMIEIADLAFLTWI